LDQPAEQRIERLAQDAFTAACEEVLAKRAEEEQQTLAEASRARNSATYPNALVILAAQRAQDVILRAIDAYLDVFTGCKVPAVQEAERFFETSAKRIAAGADPWVRGQLDLYRARTKRQVSDPGGYLMRSVNRAVSSALKKGILKLRQQRIKAELAQTRPISAPRGRSEDAAGLTAFQPKDYRGAPLSDFWESLRQGFMQLRVECAIDPPLKPAGRLTAIWTAQPPPRNWRLNYSIGKDDAGVAKRFEWAAQSGAARLGCSEEGHAALSFWLERVLLDAPASHIRIITRTDDAGLDELYSREIRDICGLSAEYCRKCAADETRPQPTESKGEATKSVTTPAKAIAEGAMELLSSWQQIRDTFLEGATAYPDFEARWDSSQWKFWDKPVGKTLKAANSAAERLFIETARLAVARLGKAREDQPCWHTLLDLMRDQKRGSRLSSPRGWVASDGRWRIRKVFAESADFCADRAATIESKLAAACAAEDGLLKAANQDHTDAVENQKGQIRTALKEAWRQRDPVQRVEDALRPMVPGVGQLRGRPFWLQVWAYLRRPGAYGMKKSEFMNLAPEDIYALLVGGGVDALPEGESGTEPRRPGWGGRAPEGLDIDTESLRKDWIGDTSLKAFARFGRISEDTLQRVLKTGKATQKTLDAIRKAGKVKSLQLNVKRLLKNPPQKPQ
jgi:hypothetical protein